MVASRDIGQHKTRKIVDRMIGLYAKSHSSKFLCPESFDKRLQAFLSAGASACANPNHSKGKRDIVAGRDQVCWVSVAVAIEEPNDCVPAQVHERLRLGKQHSRADQRDLGDLRVRFISKAA